MKLINKENISHIIIFKPTKGLKFGDTFQAVTYYGDEYFWRTYIKTVEKGFYRLGKKSHWYKLDDDIFDESKHYTLLGAVWTRQHIDIYSAGKKIHTKYFQESEDLEQHIKENYNNCNIQYGK